MFVNAAAGAHHAASETPMKAEVEQEVASGAPDCPFCGSDSVVRAGRCKLVGGIRQIWRCAACFRRFSSDRKTAHRTHPAAILDPLCMVCQGYSYDDVLFALPRRQRVRISKGTISKWVGEDVRQAESVPLLDRLYERMNEIAAERVVLPSSLLAKAMGYAINQRLALYRYTTDGRLEIVSPLCTHLSG